MTRGNDWRRSEPCYTAAMEPALPLKVLVVDDNEANRDVARETLEDEGYDVTVAANGEEALAAFERVRPNCILLDVRMPGMDGFAVCSKVRSLPEGAGVSVVFLTALRDIDTFEHALRAGGDDFVTKPVNPAELALRVQAALKFRRMDAELRDSYALLRRQRDDLMRLTLQKDRLTSFVVHDLKNPVNAMDLHAQLLLANKSLPPEAKDSLLQIRGEARALLRLVLNLLDISKSEEGRLTAVLSDVDLSKLAAEVVDAFNLRAQATQISVRRQIDVGTIRADADLLRRVLENLLDNALRHAPARSQISLEAQLRDGWLELCVADQGGGVPPELRDKIFERYVQVESQQSPMTRTGRGLGLTFCKLAVEAHGGTITLEDGDPGAVFRVRLPQAG
jgi:two-component system, sensor histidine kinase and response regulator